MEWRVSPANIILIAAYDIGANGTRTHTQDAYWYEITIVHNGKQHKFNFYGGQAAVFGFNGEKVRVISWNRSESAALQPQPGVLALPLDNTVVQEVISFFKGLERPPKAEPPA